MWKKVHGICDEAPKLGPFPSHTLTKVSGSSAVLYGPECWLLNLDNARQLKEPTSIWTRIQVPFPGAEDENHASVLEPLTNRHLTIGSNEVIKITFNVVQLKTLAMDTIARNMDAYGERLTSNYPKKLRREIMEHRSTKMED